ncbi:carbon-nitrogen hydrolase [Gorgonomyces haynaldii]|nr:carbon-nitrogen hydrolase [Gorgonomyces haynaldii]
MSTFRLGLVQLLSTANKHQNLQRASELVKKAKDLGSDVVVLPECFNSPYGTQYFKEYAEQLGGETCNRLSEMAKTNQVYLVGGSFPESKDGQLFNTATVWDPEGKMIAVHRKIHLFDIHVPGKIKFQESEILSAGNEMTHFETKYGKIGLGICYDIRFPELAMIAARKGCFMMLYPGAFNMVTGPLHWELLQRARAIDNQIYVSACSPARDTDASYVAYGYSSVVDPMGRVVARLDEKEDVLVTEIDLNQIQEARTNIPVYTQRRFDLYKDVSQ